MAEITVTKSLSREQLHYYYRVLYGYYGGPYRTAWVRKSRRKTKRGG